LTALRVEEPIAAGCRRGAPQRLAAEHLGRGGDRPLRSGEYRGRGEQLGDVGVELSVSGRQLREAEVGEPRLAGVVDDDVGESQIAVGDSSAVQCIHLLPHGRQRLVVDRIGGSEGSSGHGLEGEEHRVDADVTRSHQLGRAHTAGPCCERQRGLVFDLPANRQVRQGVASVLQPHGPGGAIERVRGLLLGSHHLDEQTVSVGGRREPG
jgi:hypothetical protein